MSSSVRVLFWRSWPDVLVFQASLTLVWKVQGSPVSLTALCITRESASLHSHCVLQWIPIFTTWFSSSSQVLRWLIWNFVQLTASVNGTLTVFHALDLKSCPVSMPAQKRCKLPKKVLTNHYFIIAKQFLFLPISGGLWRPDSGPFLKMPLPTWSTFHTCKFSFTIVWFWHLKPACLFYK